MPPPSARGGDERTDKGVWLSIWVDDVDAVHDRAVDNGIEVFLSPEVLQWGVSGCYLRHPGGHLFHVSTSIEPATAD